MNIRRFLVILLLLLLPIQVTLAAADGCCLKAKVTQAGEHAVADASDDSGIDGSCCTSCDFCHHSHAPFVGVVDESMPQATSIAPVQPPEPPIYSFIPDLPPRPNWLQ